MNFSLKNRIAFNYIISTALLIFAVFLVIYYIVAFTVYKEVNEKISYEVSEYLEKLEISKGGIHFINKSEWEQHEHSDVSVNPVFLELTSIDGKVIEKSENLKSKNLSFTKNSFQVIYKDLKLTGKLIRQTQVPLFLKHEIKGYLLVAVSLDESSAVLSNLRNILFLLYPIVLSSLFFVARFIAGKTIKPIRNIIETSQKISQENLNSRIDLPENKDELFTLAQTINELLDRIQNAVEREKQLTSDTSHELRTPLAIIKGTLEVLIRKPRTMEEYEDKINFCVSEIDRLNTLITNMLLLARYENQRQDLQNNSICLNSSIADVITRFAQKIKTKNITTILDFSDDFYILSDDHLVGVILTNCISNALKYSRQDSNVTIKLYREKQYTVCSIEDNGIGIPKADLNKIFDTFYRSNEFNHPDIKGTGLGLSIVKRLCHLLNVCIEIESQEQVGTTVFLKFLI